ncbi:MAG: hypothetical protein V4568_04530 [Pseudomonadota bacterium]
MPQLLPYLLTFALLSFPVFAQQDLEIIKLRNRSADQVLPQITPFVESTGTVTGTGYQIFLRTSQKNREQIRDIIAALDKPLRRLMITVKQDNDGDIANTGTEISGNIGNGNGRITQRRSGNLPGATVEIRRGDNIVQGRSYSTQGNTSDRVSQQLQVVEGGQAFINVGQSLPVPLHQVVVTPGGAIVSDSTVYRDIGTGFYAAPIVSGDRVTLEINPNRDTRGNAGPGSVNVQRLSTTVSGQLGEWIELGGTSADQSGSESGVTRYSTRSASDKRRILLKVEELP